MKKNVQYSDHEYAGLSEFEVKALSWQLFTFSGETYIKKDLHGNFIHTTTGKQLGIDKLFPQIRNCTDAAGYIIAKRKKHGRPLRTESGSRRKRMPIPV